MGVFANTWTDDRFTTEAIKAFVATAVVVAFGTVLTQYSVSQWIWNKRPPHRAPVYLVAWIPFLVLSSLLFDKFYADILSRDLPNQLAYEIAVPLVVLGGVPLNLAFCWIWSWAKLFPAADSSQDFSKKTNDIESKGNAISQPTEKATEAEATEAEATEAEATEADATGALVDKDPPKKKQKVYYVSNIKIFLTCVVIIHHSFSGLYGTAEIGTPIYFAYSDWYIFSFTFLDLNQSYFMNLFFFWSGYFIPKSLDRKGTYMFLIERAKRIGIPFVIYNFFLGPYVLRGSQYLLLSPRDKPFSTYMADGKIFTSGPTWFLLHLILFGVAYTFGCGKGWSPKASCPSFWGFIGIGLLLGIYSGVMGMFFPPLPVLLVPYFFNFYLSYAVFFFGGALAQRNNWMEDIKSMNRLLIYSFTIITATAVYALRWLVIDTYVPFWGQQLFYGLTTSGGFLTVSWSLTVTVFFMDYMDKKFFCTEFFNNAMYTAYIIHYVFPRIVGWKCGILLFESIGSMEFVEDQVIEGFNAPPPPLYYDSDADMFIPFCFFSAAVTLLITWPLAYAIRSIPGFSKVL